jgi:protein-S-isoprenylcysteine O-methyltransferase Ste14
MALHEEMIRSGNRLFRYRSFIPIVLYLFAAAAIFISPNDLVSYDNVGWQLTCLAISLSGLVLRAITIGHTPRGTSGRNTKEGQVAEVLNTTGMYSLVRHPLYLGNFLMWLGLIIYAGTMWFVVLSVLFFWIYYERIMLAEEAFIRNKFGKEYDEWSVKVPAFLPNKLNWVSPGLSFSWKNVLKREYSGLFATFLSFALIDLMKSYSYQQKFHIQPVWLYGFLAAGVVFITLRSLKKYTHVLEVEGR